MAGRDPFRCAGAHIGSASPGRPRLQRRCRHGRGGERDGPPPDLVSIAPQPEQLGLTRMQALVAMAIGRGSSPREAAELLAIREGTVRVHLEAIFGRLGLRRQSELAIIVARLDAILRRRREREGGTER
ncbi:LuxR C-terminal-related transcriptional regulator [Methylobacterium sp. Leaf106]|uniref:LuxR C-terminal-related transcriptional regulator n=1 Tax=Methylobacterium sp. Leaf106 TaxID=1736255 RepID=UPI0012E73893|nr:LuxR C-terminal-related transcriptional regulator [Methylobacterium sp. Leaf106]